MTTMVNEIPVKRPGTARRILRARLKGMSDDIVDIAELLVSELITNALVHGAGDPELVLTVDPPRIRVEVRDADPTVDFGPVVGEASRTHGRGLAIVDALATSWGVEPRWDGKAVWFVLEF